MGQRSALHIHNDPLHDEGGQSITKTCLLTAGCAVRPYYPECLGLRERSCRQCINLPMTSGPDGLLLGGPGTQLEAWQANGSPPRVNGRRLPSASLPPGLSPGFNLFSLTSRREYHPKLSLRSSQPIFRNLGICSRRNEMEAQAQAAGSPWDERGAAGVAVPQAAAPIKGAILPLPRGVHPLLIPSRAYLASEDEVCHYRRPLRSSTRWQRICAYYLPENVCRWC